MKIRHLPFADTPLPSFVPSLLGKTRRSLLWAFAVGCLISLLPQQSLAGMFATTINWVGYQYGPIGGTRDFPRRASFFSGDQWLNYLVPGHSNSAVFDTSYDPRGNGKSRQQRHQIHAR